MRETELILYAARDVATGKLVSDITNPRKKFWHRKASAIDAINKAVRKPWNKYESLELVTFKLVEVEDDGTN